MTVTTEQIQDAITRAKEEIAGTGIAGQDHDITVAVMAALDMIGARNITSSDQQYMPLISKFVPEIDNLPETFAEWANHYNLKTHFDRFLAIMVYLRDRNKTAVITSDVLSMYEKARWAKPANAADVFAKGASRSLFTEADDEITSDDGSKMWRITRTGYSHFESLKLEI